MGGQSARDGHGVAPELRRPAEEGARPGRDRDAAAGLPRRGSAPEQLDLARVRSLVDAARASEPVRRAALLDDALALWRGEPLAEFRYETFAREEIARLEEFHLTLVEERAEAKLAIGAHAEVVSELEALVRAHPLRERLRAQLMLALYRSGRQAQALEAYREGRELLVEELGLEPSPLLRGVHASILRQETFAVDRGAIPEVEHFEEVAAALLAGKVTVVVGSDSEQLASELARRFGVETDTRSSRASPRPWPFSTARARSTTRSTRSSRETGNRRPSTVSLRGCRHCCVSARAAQPLLVTTGYELALERALEDVEEQYETVCYLAAGQMRGSFCHIAPSGVRERDRAAERIHRELALDERTVLLHLQGRIDRSSERAWESFAVTEDDFIHYGDVARRLPVSLAARLRRTHLLLLGYTLSTWTLRVVLERFWGSEPLPYRSWSVHPGPQPLEREFWRRRDVEVVDMAPAAVRRRARAGAGEGGGLVSGVPQSPYKGLASFEDSELDALLFFGREREIAAVAANVLANRLTVLYGPSGVGKSSLLGEGVRVDCGS